MDIVSSVYGFLAYGMSSCYDFFFRIVNAVSPLGMTLLLIALGVSLVWRYLVGQLFK